MPRLFVKFPSIEQFRTAIKTVTNVTQYAGLDEQNKPVFDDSIPLPTIEMRGTVKLHGTNAGVGFSDDTGIWAQSRNTILDKNDGFGFRQFVFDRREIFTRVVTSLPHTDTQVLCVFGEFCGKGIQKNVALQELSKMFVVFAACVVENDLGETQQSVKWFSETEVSKLKSPEHLIYNIYDFPTWTISVDFNNPAASQAKLTEITDKVEQQCPVAHMLGVDGVGEGVVWAAHHETIGKVCFKVKGEKHAVVKRKNTKNTAPIDVEKVESLRVFVEYAVTENRLLQAVEQVFTAQGKTVSLKKMHDFIQWVQSDVIKEENDTLEKNKLQQQDVLKEIANKARSWLLEYCKRA